MKTISDIKGHLKFSPFEDVFIYEERKERKVLDSTVQVLSYIFDFHLVHLPILENLGFSIFNLIPVCSS